MTMIQNLWPHIMAVCALCVMLLSVAHVVLYKRDTRAAVGWAGVIFLFPFLGPLLYFLLGINRVKRKAVSLRRKTARDRSSSWKAVCVLKDNRSMSAEEIGYFSMLDSLASGITGKALSCGNKIEPLHHGDEAYPAMLQAIHDAKDSIALATYIFANDKVGNLFVKALSQAVSRGVKVCVLIDDVGARYSFPPILGKLRRAGVPTSRFMPTLVPWRTHFINLRNHRKILVVDGKIGFTGGMNISAKNLLKESPLGAVRDHHFCLEGPIVSHLQEAFCEDWQFTTGERLQGEKWFPPLDEKGSVFARGITDGPDADNDKLLDVVLGALACAKKSVKIMTPYFLPEAILISALNIAAMRGVRIDILLPRKSDHPLVEWAASGQMDQILEQGCRVGLLPPPFIHTKLMLIDDLWVMIGSGNWDPRSFRLNFEFNVECYDRELAKKLNRIFDEKLRTAEWLSLEAINNRSLPVKLRDGLARLLISYL